MAGDQTRAGDTFVAGMEAWPRNRVKIAAHWWVWLFIACSLSMFFFAELNMLFFFFLLVLKGIYHWAFFDSFFATREDASDCPKPLAFLRSRPAAEVRFVPGEGAAWRGRGEIRIDSERFPVETGAAALARPTWTPNYLISFYHMTCLTKKQTQRHSENEIRC